MTVKTIKKKSEEKKMPSCRRVTAFSETTVLLPCEREVFSKDSEGVLRSPFRATFRHLNASKRLEINESPVSGENENKCSALNNKRINFIWLLHNRPTEKKKKKKKKRPNNLLTYCIFKQKIWSTCLKLHPWNSRMSRVFVVLLLQNVLDIWACIFFT